MLIESVGEQTYDVAVVGSGPAGTSLALRLAERTEARVLLVESGGLRVDPAILSLSEVGADGDLPPEYYPRHAVRLFGGTSGVWTGYCQVLERRAFAAGDWPIPYEDLEPYYAGAAEILELPPESHRAPSRRIVPGVPVRYRPYFLSPPVRFYTKYLDRIRSHQAVDLLLRHTCTDLLVEEGAVRALSVRPSTEPGDTGVAVRAGTHVLACGGIGNARLLQLAKLAGGSPVGRYLSDHPHVYRAGRIQIRRDLLDAVRAQGNVVHALQLSDAYCLENDLRSFTVGLEIDQVADRPILGRSVPVYLAGANVRAEMVPREDNRVRLDEPRDRLGQPRAHVDFRFDFSERGRRTWDAFARELLVAGIGRATVAPAFRNITGGGHHVGTTRMGRSPRDSVVDADCKVHGLGNLFVAGSSVFAAPGAANPTFSIVALSLRLADHLALRMRRPS